MSSYSSRKDASLRMSRYSGQPWLMSTMLTWRSRRPSWQSTSRSMPSSSQTSACTSNVSWPLTRTSWPVPLLHIHANTWALQLSGAKSWNCWRSATSTISVSCTWLSPRNTWRTSRNMPTHRTIPTSIWRSSHWSTCRPRASGRTSSISCSFPRVERPSSRRTARTSRSPVSTMLTLPTCLESSRRQINTYSILTQPSQTTRTRLRTREASATTNSR